MLLRESYLFFPQITLETLEIGLEKNGPNIILHHTNNMQQFHSCKFFFYNGAWPVEDM